MCVYRNVIRLLAAASVTGSAIIGIAGSSAAQPPAPNRVEMAASPIELVAAGRTLLWSHDDGDRRALYTASAPDYVFGRVTAGEGDDLPDLITWGPTSPDGAWVLYLRDGLLYQLASDDANPLRAEGTPLFVTRGVITHAVWSPDGSRIAFVMLAPKARTSGSGALNGVPSFIGIHDVESGRRWFLSPAIEQDSSPVWSADGSEVFFQRSTRPAGDALVQIGAGSTGARGGAILIGDVETGVARVIWTHAEEVALIGPHGSAEDGSPVRRLAMGGVRAGKAPLSSRE